MTTFSAAIILPGCLLFFFQVCWSRSHLSSSAEVSCKSTDYISCLIVNLEYVECNWTKPETQQIKVTFSSAFEHTPFRKCPDYLWEHGQHVGCRILLKEQTQRFGPFYTKLSVGGSQLLCRNYTDLKQRVKLDPPYNLSVNSSGRDGEVCARWISSTKIKKDCMNYMLRYQKAGSPWKSSSSDCVSPLSSGVVYTFQVRSRMSDVCGASLLWSDWSEPAQWNDGKDVMIAEQPLMYWHVLGSVLGVMVLIILSLLLCYSERIKVVFVPVVPDPSKSLQDLFKKHNGSVESWVHISRELKDAFEPEYTESPCVVRDPNLTSETKAEAGPKEQPVY